METDDPGNREWTWYVFGKDRFSKLRPGVDQQPSETPVLTLSSGSPAVFGSYTFFEDTDFDIEPEFYIHDHLGNTRVVYTPVVGPHYTSYTLGALVDYFPYGKVLRSYYNGEEERYLTTHHERDAETGLDYRGARFYDSDNGRFLSLDPLAMEFANWTGYNYVLSNPIIFVDPNGKFPGEYKVTHDEDGNEVKTKVSDLGDDVNIDFNHHLDGVKAGQTEIVNLSNGCTNWISDSRFINGYTRRGSETDWYSVYQEWKNGWGPEKSLFFGAGHPMIENIRRSNLYNDARDEYLELGASGSGNGKKYIPMDFGLYGLIASGNNMTMQMIGSGGVSFYEIGNNQRLVMITDSKTRESFYYHLPWINNYDRGSKTYNIPGTWIYDDREANTHQTYIWVE